MTLQEMDHLRQVEALFDAALEYPAGPVREAWLEQQNATAPEVLAEARLLLDAHEQLSAAAPERPEVLPQFGPWQATRVLGRGGMGVVYLVERADGAFRMTAAVKVVPLALTSEDMEERFRRERQFLASLSHPKIARLIDGGVSSAGLPYLVMDYVDGLAIDRYCETRNLDTRERVGLMRQVLDALIYVHGRQVIHRDVKPSNILVDVTGSVKMLDFGTARLVDASGDTAITKTGASAFTPDYASPEQAAGEALTFASDIYSAGVVLYRMLTGRPPYRLKSRWVEEIARTIGHEQPEPSGLEAPLDAILNKALRKNPADRYASAAEMDADLARYLKGEPVRARQPRRLWQVAALSMIVLSAGSMGWWRLHRSSAPPVPVSIAVLPFMDVNNDAANQYFVNGLTQEVAGEIASLKSIRVAPQSSSKAFQRQPRDAREIGKKLKVTHILDVTVERSFDQVTIVASLERTSDGAKLWTNTYRRAKADLAVVETDLEQAIAATLKVPAPVAPGKHVAPEEARDAVRKARFEADQMTTGANALAQQDFRRAIALDPDYAVAYQGLASAIWNRNIIAGERPVLAERQEAERLLQKAIHLDPGFLVAHAMLGNYAMQYDWDWKRAEREYRTVIAAGRNVTAESMLALLYLITGQRREADQQMEHARDLDPLGSLSAQMFEVFLEVEGRSAEAREECRKILDRNPGALNWKVQLNFLDARLGKIDDAVRNLRGLAREPDAGVVLAQVEALAGNREEALRILRPWERDYQNGKILMSDFAEVYAALGDEPNTVKWLERAMDSREMPAMYIHVDPVYSKMQDTPEFHRLKRRMNLDW
jgi:serine/threonine protein kinase